MRCACRGVGAGHPAALKIGLPERPPTALHPTRRPFARLLEFPAVQAVKKGIFRADDNQILAAPASAVRDRFLPRPSPQGCPQIGHGNHERHRFQRGNLQSQTQIKCLGLLVQGVHQQTANAYCLRGVHHPQSGIAE